MVDGVTFTFATLLSSLSLSYSKIHICMYTIHTYITPTYYPIVCNFSNVLNVNLLNRELFSCLLLYFFYDFLLFIR